MYVKTIDSEKELELWVIGLNESFKSRSSEKIPFEQITKDNISVTDHNIFLGVYEGKNKLLGGACVLYCTGYNNVKVAKIGQVWTMPSCQKQGVGNFLIQEIERIAVQSGKELLQLNVSNIYLPAVNLYKKRGFKKLMIYANEPETYYFIRMIKEIGDFKFSNIKRLCILLKSILIFKILYKKDSSPTLFNKLIYSK